MEFGAHLPLIELDGGASSLAGLRDYAKAAAGLGFTFLCANDHLLYARPWLDGPTALAAVVEHAEGMTLATTVCLPVIRGPVQTAKTLAALDILSGGRLVVGVGPGSSERDYAAAGIPFDERWPRFEEATLRAAVAPGGRSNELRGAVLLDPGHRPGADEAAGATDLGRQLGLEAGAQARRTPCRRLARLGLQHDAGGVSSRPRLPRS